jgi:hypothetical protein
METEHLKKANEAFDRLLEEFTDAKAVYDKLKEEFIINMNDPRMGFEESLIREKELIDKAKSANDNLWRVNNELAVANKLAKEELVKQFLLESQNQESNDENSKSIKNPDTISQEYRINLAREKENKLKNPHSYKKRFKVNFIFKNKTKSKVVLSDYEYKAIEQVNELFQITYVENLDDRDYLEVVCHKTGKIIQVAHNDFESTLTAPLAKKVCKSLGRNWRLPTIDELEDIFNQLHINEKGNFINSSYCSDNEHNERVEYLDFNTGKICQTGFPYYGFNIRPVRDKNFDFWKFLKKSIKKATEFCSRNWFSIISILPVSFYIFWYFLLLLNITGICGMQCILKTQNLIGLDFGIL